MSGQPQGAPVPELPCLGAAIVNAGRDLGADDAQMMTLHLTRDEHVIVAHALRLLRAQIHMTQPQEDDALKSISDAVEENVAEWDALQALKAGEL